MHRLIIAALLLIAASTGRGADGVLIRDVFRTMPDSLMPYLTENNRLDLIDFIDAHMEARVRNSLGGTTQMTALTADSLSISMSDALRLDMLLVQPQGQTADSCRVVCLVETFGVDSISRESTVRYFSLQWQPLAAAPPLSPRDQRRIDSLKVQTILKWNAEILKED